MHFHCLQKVCLGGSDCGHMDRIVQGSSAYVHLQTWVKWTSWVGAGPVCLDPEPWRQNSVEQTWQIKHICPALGPMSDKLTVFNP